MKLDYPPVEPGETFRPSKVAGLEEKTILLVRVEVSHAEAMRAMGHGWTSGENFTKEALTLLESGARVGVDRWLENGGAATVGLAWYLTEPQVMAPSVATGSSFSYWATVRAVRGLMTVNGTLHRHIEGRTFATINAGRGSR